MQVTKLDFTAEELSVLNNSHFFTVKLSATKKIMTIFGQLEADLKAEMEITDFDRDEGLNISSGKIFRGENYHNLPYVMLDFPRLFNTKSVFAFRNMFWWANGFSFTLHLQGEAWKKRKKKIQKNLHKLQGQGFFICVNDTPWQYHFEPTNYVELDNFLNMNRGESLSTMSFIKLCTRLDTSRYSEAIATSRSTFKSLMNLIEDQDPM